MKKLLALACISAPLLASAWNVGTEPTRQNALIEEFTGINCQNCPAGHRTATELMNRHDGEVYTVALHSGAFAVATRDKPDFVTATGTAIHDHFGVNSYPCAVVNRKDTGSGVVQGRASWGPSCREVGKLASPVNLWTASSYDAATRTFTVEVEAYFTEDMIEPRLNVFLLQNEILGPQSGGELGVEYPHRHMFRTRLTDNDFGDAMEQNGKGEYFARTFTYVLPEKIGTIPTDAVNTEFLVFVTEGTDDVVKVSDTRPDTSGLEQIFSVSTSAAPIAIEKNYALDYLEIYINNHGGIDVTSATFNVALGGDTETVEWTGTVPAHTNRLVRVPVGEAWKDAYDTEANQYVLRMTKANGREVECASIRGKFNEIFAYPAELTVKIKTDLDAADNTWRIIDENGNTVKEFGPYPDGLVGEYTETVSLEDGRVYGIEITDCWGDGVCHPLGSMKLYDSAGALVAQIKEIKDYGMRQFFRASGSAGVCDVAAGADLVSRKFFDLSGRKVAAPGAGIYIVRSEYSDGSVSIEKLIKND